MDTVKIVSQKIILKNEFYDHVIDRFFCLDVKHRKNRKIDDRKITREQNIFG